MGKYLERMKISDARKLADTLDIALIDLLDASLCLTKNVRNCHAERLGEAAEINDPNVAIAV